MLSGLISTDLVSTGPLWSERGKRSSALFFLLLFFFLIEQDGNESHEAELLVALLLKDMFTKLTHHFKRLCGASHYYSRRGKKE